MGRTPSLHQSFGGGERGADDAGSLRRLATAVQNHFYAAIGSASRRRAAARKCRGSASNRSTFTSRELETDALKLALECRGLGPPTNAQMRFQSRVILLAANPRS
jgi:hypothetical protein